ncbi:hypothetical protein Rleg4DRAFT_7743 [Rhizobium leguminosarum bv. trifolii WSM2297]|uniref:Uncharacterized protein n=1 Tax=Rhizobium leguminosarum bv. trifolii WSM2297 TaxID=754762 RepID=J0CN41_RHILT|nr:hypothetical protein [Rhizobium leguminosarum]EJC85272.1 hypothetical protein Rleg4DRAFT_7148 [Rhizobium leguminosarum bv. trifolii WSM2297]EJC85843.1 hypothetical protein Rleg4DRAFT_7743 [Rhizobium leguminosarum bv. trifolii WSM2297]
MINWFKATNPIVFEFYRQTMELFATGGELPVTAVRSSFPHRPIDGIALADHGDWLSEGSASAVNPGLLSRPVGIHQQKVARCFEQEANPNAPPAIS